MKDGKAFGAEVVGIVKSFMENAVEPLVARLDALEKRFDQLPAPRDGKDADLDEVRQIIAAELADLRASVETIEPAPTLPELPDIPALVADAVKTAVDALPPPADGASVTIEDVAPMIAKEVQKRVDALPRAKDGEDGEDGIGLAGALIDRSGNLVITLSNGEAKELGPVVGKDADPAQPGRDGLGFEDMDEELADDGRTIIRRYRRGDEVKEFRHSMPVILDRGVFKDGQGYAQGDAVTWAGSLWIAQQKTAEKPDSGNGWRLAVKRGRDGKPAPVASSGTKEPVRVGVPARAD